MNLKINPELLARVRARIAEKEAMAELEKPVAPAAKVILPTTPTNRYQAQSANIDLAQRLRAAQQAAYAEEEQETTSTTSTVPTASGIQYNEKQLAFVELASSGKSCVLIGAAGTGKTTCMKGVVSSLIANDLAGVIGDNDHPLLTRGTPGIVVVSFTRRAVANIRKQMPPELKSNCLTIHKLLEYQPVRDEVYDQASGETRNRIQFKPTRHENNPLPTSIHTIIVEESSMVGGSPRKEDDYLLFNCLVASLLHPVQFIFLGDIQQLPPVFGPAILGFKMLELPTIELTEVYRQALESPIIRLAHRILSGKPIAAQELPEWEVPGQLKLQPFKVKLKEEMAIRTVSAFLIDELRKGNYNPDEDAVLIPFNKGVGTLEVNRHIATELAIRAGREVHEIVAGFESIYLSVGDRVLIDREEAVITDIRKNPAYMGKAYKKASTTMNYFGYDSAGAQLDEVAMDDDAIDAMIEAMAGNDSEEYKRQASHIIKFKRPDNDYEFTLTAAGDVNSILLAYAITIHKSQGSEWRKVYLILHHTHTTMLQRELLYTAVTRARQHLHVICEPDSFVKGITKQKIPGQTWKDKAQYFMGKLKVAASMNKVLHKAEEEED